MRKVQGEIRMRNLGKYCKAYPITALRSYRGWRENLQNLQTEQRTVDGEEIECRRDLTDDSYLFLQENYIVTDGIFLDENVIFDDVTQEWKDYCRNVLGFESSGAASSAVAS
jgi:hypothetical protein